MPTFTDFKLIDWFKDLPKETLFLSLVGVGLLVIVLIQHNKLKEVM